MYMNTGISKKAIIIIIIIVILLGYFVVKGSKILNISKQQDINIPQNEQEFIDSSQDEVPADSTSKKQEYLDSFPDQKQQNQSGNVNIQQKKQDFLNEFNS